MVIVYLAVIVLSALAVSTWRRSSSRPRSCLAMAVTVVLLDFGLIHTPRTELTTPRIYDVLHDRPESGALCELPVGVRDGFGEWGTLDHRVLFYQSVHERPLVGGFVARLSPRVRADYGNDPLFAALLHLSGAATEDTPTNVPDRETARRLLNHHGIRFVMLNRHTASSTLIKYVETTMPVTLLTTEKERQLFIVD